jgi:hypothetical protein
MIIVPAGAMAAGVANEIVKENNTMISKPKTFLLFLLKIILR